MSSELPLPVFRAGLTTFALDCDAPALRSRLEIALTDLATDAPASIRLEIRSDDEGFVVRSDGGEEHRAGTEAEAIGSVITAVTRIALDHETDELHLHAAAIEREGRGVLISAMSGAGKTTLTGALLEHGWSYVSDESVAFENDSLDCRGFPKPLMIKAFGTADTPVASLRRTGVDLSEMSYNWAVPASRIGAPIVERVEASLVVILEPPASGGFDEPPKVSHLHPTDAVVKLMSQTMDAERFGPEALEALVSRAANATCVALQTGQVDETADLVGRLAAADSPTHEIQRLDVQPGLQTAWVPRTSVRSSRVDDRVVAHDTDSGNVMALDESGSALWMALYGQPPAWWANETLELESTTEFLEQLRHYGFVERSDPSARHTT